jgi:hypothetical protein
LVNRRLNFGEIFEAGRIAGMARSAGFRHALIYMAADDHSDGGAATLERLTVGSPISFIFH